MSKRLVACTSTGCIEFAPERYRNLGIEIIRVHMFFKGKEYLEGPDFDPVQFYKDLETLEDPRNNLPTTGIPTPEEIKNFHVAYLRFSSSILFRQNQCKIPHVRRIHGIHLFTFKYPFFGNRATTRSRVFLRQG